MRHRQQLFLRHDRHLLPFLIVVADQAFDNVLQPSYIRTRLDQFSPAQRSLGLGLFLVQWRHGAYFHPFSVFRNQSVRERYRDFACFNLIQRSDQVVERCFHRRHRIHHLFRYRVLRNLQILLCQLDAQALRVDPEVS